MITQDYSFWLRFFGTLAFEAGVVVAAARLVQEWTQSVQKRKCVWQTCFLVLMFAAGAELSGLGNGLSMSLIAVSNHTPTTVLEGNEPTPVVSASAHTNPQLVVINPQREKAIWWPGILFLTGAGICLGRIVLSRVLLAYLHWNARQLKGECHKQTAQIAARLGLKQPVRLLELRALSSPITFGLFKPCIGLPHDFTTRFDRPSQDAILSHEIAHCISRDPLWHLLADIACVLLWWHPLAWWARSQLHLASELAADQASASLENGPELLAESLVQLAREHSRFGAFAWIAVRGTRSSLSERVERLLSHTQRDWKPLNGYSILFAKTGATFLLAIAVILASGWTQTRSLRHQQSFSDNLKCSWKASVSGVLLAAIGTQPEQLQEGSISQTNTVWVAARKTVQVSKGSDPVYSAHLAAEGKRLYESANSEAAEIILKRALEADPSNKTAFYYLRLVLEAKNSKSALPELQHPTNPPKPVLQQKELSQVSLSTWCALVDAHFIQALGLDTLLKRNVSGAASDKTETNSTSAITGIMTAEQHQTLLKALEKQNGVELINAPKITTLSGRGAVVYMETSNMHPQNTPPFLDERTPPWLDVLATTQDDGFAIHLVLATGISGSAPKMFPTSTSHKQCTVWDSQVALISHPVPVQEKTWLVMVKAELIDAKGNLIHRTEQMPFTRNSIPPQGSLLWRK